MRIKKIKYKKHPILGNLELDFTSENNKAEDIIFLAGENGCGKTTIIDNIFDVIASQVRSNVEYTIIYLLELNDNDIEFVKNGQYQYLLDSISKEKEINIEIDKNNSVFVKKGQNKIYIGGLNALGCNQISKCIYSAAEINFNANKIRSVTSMEIDQSHQSEKQSKDLSERITQLLVDIKSQDDADLSEWVNNNDGIAPPNEVKEKRMRRFKNAFKYIFEDDLTFDSVRNVDGHKEIYFKRNGNIISIDNLSSGEKQIVYRGSFILQNDNNLVNSIILIDEPELSLHPRWQGKIVEYFRRICTDDFGKQVCQMIISTHSPFILHSEERKNDKVIILDRDEKGNIYQPVEKEFYKCGSMEVIKEAFKLNKYLDDIKALGKTTIVITEGKTDTKHLEVAMKRLNISGLDISFLQIEEQWGDTKLATLLESLKLIPKDNKIIGIFDRDKNNMLKDYNLYSEEYVNLGKNVYAFAIPIVRNYGDKISIEHYYREEDLKKENEFGRRLFLGSEFNEKSSISLDGKYFTKISQIQNKVKINGIIDEKVYKIEDINAEYSVAMSKNDFANLLENEEFSKDFDFSEFSKIFDIIRKIVTS